MRDRFTKTHTSSHIGPIGSIGFAFYSTQEPGYWGFSIFTAILGSFAYPILPISYELSVETTYPVGPATSAGLNWVFASLAAIVMELVFNPLKKTMDEIKKGPD